MFEEEVEGEGDEEGNEEEEEEQIEDGDVVSRPRLGKMGAVIYFLNTMVIFEIWVWVQYLPLD